MFCPGCGSEERQASQYCRACGTDLRAVRVSLERPDSITASAVTAREEIGRAVADQIRRVEDSHDLKRVAEDVLPQIEKFLESPREAPAARARRSRYRRRGFGRRNFSGGNVCLHTGCRCVVWSFWFGVGGFYGWPGTDHQRTFLHQAS